MAGLSFNGVCYPDSSTALMAFQRDFQNSDSSTIKQLNSSSINDRTITYNISTRSLDNDNPPLTRTGTFQLNNCDYAYFQMKDVPSMFLIVAIFFAAMMGFKTGFKA